MAVDNIKVLNFRENMFEQLFGSKTRVKLIRLFLDNPEKYFYVRELTRLTNSMINSIRRELDNLVNLKLIVCENPKGAKKDLPTDEKGRKVNTKKFYKLNANNIFQADLQKLFSKGKIIVEKKFIERIKRIGDVHFISLGGVFVDDSKAQSDMLVIGDFEKRRVMTAVEKFEQEIGLSIKYTIMDMAEYELRRDISDRFLKEIMDNENNINFVDKLSKTKTKINE